MDKSDKQSVALALIRATVRFCNVNDFKESKRFKRFCKLTEEKIDSILFRSGAHKRQVGDCKGKPLLFHDICQFAVIDHFDCQFAGGKKDAPLEVIENDITQAIRGNFYSAFNTTADRNASSLWSYFHMLCGLQKDEQAAIDVVQTSASYILYKMWDEIYVEALEHACFDFIRLKAAEDKLTEDNWLTSLKQVTDEQILHIMSRTFETALFDVEDRTYFRLTCIGQDSGITKEICKRFISNEDVSDAAKELEQKQKQIETALSEDKAKCKQLEAENASLKVKYNSACSAFEKVKRLQRELTEEKKKNAELKAKYKSVVEYADSLSLEENETEAENEETTDLEKIRYKRIVFVRDKKHEGYVLFDKLAEIFPNAKFTNGIASDIDAQTTDLIVALTRYECHGTYWGAESYAKGKGIPFYKAGSANVDNIIKVVAEAFKKKEK